MLNLKTHPIATPPKPAYNLWQSADLLAENRVASRQEFLKNIPLFADLGPAELEALAQDFVRRQFKQGETIFYQGDPGQSLFLIETGQVRIFVEGEVGQATSVIMYGPGEIFGELAVIDELPRSATVAAMRDTVVYQLTQERFRDNLRRSPQLALNFLKALSVRIRYNTSHVESLALLEIPARLARKLLELAKQYGVADPRGVRINLELSQSDLASLIGTTRESINKTIGIFRKRGLVVMDQGQVIITDLDTLRELS